MDYLIVFLHFLVFIYHFHSVNDSIITNFFKFIEVFLWLRTLSECSMILGGEKNVLHGQLGPVVAC